MNILFSNTAWQQYQFWQKEDEKIISRINILIKEIQRDPFIGIGKPEPLRQNYKGFWSRRITREHRLVYRIKEDANKVKRIEILICQFHYKK